MERVHAQTCIFKWEKENPSKISSPQSLWINSGVCWCVENLPAKISLSLSLSNILKIYCYFFLEYSENLSKYLVIKKCVWWDGYFSTLFYLVVFYWNEACIGVLEFLNCMVDGYGWLGNEFDGMGICFCLFVCFFFFSLSDIRLLKWDICIYVQVFRWHSRCLFGD